MYALALLLPLLWTKSSEATSRPIIGILAQETSIAMNKIYPGYNSYIAASYVRSVQSSGARVVPIHINRTEEYYRTLLGSINGVLFPGGGTWFFKSGGYADAGEIIFREAKKLNNEGVYMPVLGICLGFELMLFLDVDRKEYRASCWMKNIPLPLDFLPEYKGSRLFSAAPQEVIDILSKQNVTFNEHQFCVTEANMTAFGISNDWEVLSTNEDRVFNLTFVSSLESTKYPFAGLQFHPEKNMFEWRSDLKQPHTPDAIKASRYFFDWFVGEARKNNNTFPGVPAEELSLISNYKLQYTHNKLVYDEIYLFRNSGESESSSAKLNVDLNKYLLAILGIIVMLTAF